MIKPTIEISFDLDAKSISVVYKDLGGYGDRISGEHIYSELDNAHKKMFNFFLWIFQHIEQVLRHNL
jgi:hypothetical protein